MNRTVKFFYNSVAMACMQLIVMITGFITPRIILNTYGSEVNGLVSSITQFISYFNLVEAGLASAAIYALYKPLAENNIKEINGVVSAAKKFYTQSGYVFISLTCGLACIYPFYIKTQVLSPLSVGILVLILGINGALEFFTLSKYRVLLSADQKAYVISIASTVHIIVNTVITIILAKFKVHIVILKLVALLSIVLRTAILMIYCKRHYKYLSYKEEPNTESLDKRWDALFLQVLGAIHKGAPIILITLFLKDLKLVSIYSIFNMVMAGINGILSIFVSGLSASFGEVIAKGEVKTLQKAYREFELIYYSLITIVYGITFITIMPFIRIYTQGINDINYDIPILGFLFVLNGLLYNIKTPQGMLVMSAGLYKETKRQTTIQGLISVVIGALLAPSMGIIGVLLGAILSNLYRDIDLIFFIPKKLTKLPYKYTILRVLRVFLSVGIICMPFSIININPKNIFSWAGYACVVSVYTVIVVLVIGLVFERNEIHNVLRRVKRMVGKRK